jgi:hypothetical protein
MADDTAESNRSSEEHSSKPRQACSSMEMSKMKSVEIPSPRLKMKLKGLSPAQYKTVPLNLLCL